MTRLTKEQTELLKEIANDKFAVGPFSGMVFNAVISNRDMSIDEVLAKALEVRLRIKELSETTEGLL